MPSMKRPSHPGRVLKNLYLTPSELTPYKLSDLIGVPRTRINRLVNEQTEVSIDTAIRLAKFFGTSPEYWLNMQTNFNLSQAKVDVSNIEPMAMAG